MRTLTQAQPEKQRPARVCVPLLPLYFLLLFPTCTPPFFQLFFFVPPIRGFTKEYGTYIRITSCTLLFGQTPNPTPKT